MHSETQINLAKHRLETAEEKLEASKLLLAGGLFKDSIGRSYYAIFSATRAVLALDSKDFSKHAGVIACYQKDYDDYYVVLKSDAEEQLDKAELFYQEMKRYIDGVIE